MDSKEIDARFFSSVSGKTPVNETQAKQKDITSEILDLAHIINEYVPDGRYKSLALTDLESALMWANKGLYAKTTLH